MIHKFSSRAIALCLCMLLLAGCQQSAAASEPMSAVPSDAQEAYPAEPEAKVYIASGIHTWQYLDRNQAALISQTGQEWTLPGYDSSQWSQGYGPFGAKDGTDAALSDTHSITTLLNQYIEGDNDNLPSYFFRTSFHVTDPLAIQVLQAQLAYDDSVIVYLNGHKVFSGNVPENGYESNFSYGAADALGRPDAAILQLPPEFLVAGENVLAAEVHQSDKSSSDIYFDFLSLESRPGQVQLVYVGPGSDSSSVSLSWSQTGRRVEDARIFVSRLGSSEPPALYLPVQVEQNAEGYSYRVQITGLEKNGTYSYSISGGTQVSGVFCTGDDSNGTDLLLLGDPQLHMDDYEDLSQTFSSVLANAKDGLDLTVCMGDVASEAEDYPVYTGFLPKLSSGLVPTAMLFGNHDATSDNLSDCIFLPNMSQYGSSQRTGNMSGDYWFSYGGNLFLCLNSNEQDYSQHRSFLAEAEAAYRQQYGEPGWRIVLMHHALFSQGNNYDRTQIQQMREALAPMFSQMKIDVVFSGHDHTYSRSYLIRELEVIPYEGDSAVKQEGDVLYISLNSCTGAKFYDLSDRQPYTAMCEQNYRAMLTRVNITPKRMYLYTWEPENGEVIDSFSLLK